MDDQTRNQLTLYFAGTGVLTGLLGFIRSWFQDWKNGFEASVRADERQKTRIEALEQHEHEREEEGK